MNQSFMGQVHEGMDVFDQNGDKIGKAGETLDGGRYFNVDAGFLGMKEYYIPFDAVSDVRGNDVYVNASKDRLHDMGWDKRPEERFEGQTTTTTTRTSAMDTNMGTDMGQRKIELHAEELTPVKERAKVGEVDISKEVVTENKTIDVPVTREEVVVERHPVDRRPADQADFRDEGETIRVPVTEERVSVEKRPVVREEVTVGTRSVQETQPVSGTVRHEELRIDKEGDVRVAGWDKARSHYQQQYQQRHGTTGRWDTAEPNYRFGYEWRSQPEYRGRTWADAEPAMRRDWEQRYPDRPWDRARQDVHEAWDDATS